MVVAACSLVFWRGTQPKIRKRVFSLANINLKDSKKSGIPGAFPGVLTEDTVSEKWSQRSTRSWLRRSTRNRLASAAQVRVLSVSFFFLLRTARRCNCGLERVSAPLVTLVQPARVCVGMRTELRQNGPGARRGHGRCGRGGGETRWVCWCWWGAPRAGPGPEGKEEDWGEGVCLDVLTQYNLRYSLRGTTIVANATLLRGTRGPLDPGCLLVSYGR